MWKIFHKLFGWEYVAFEYGSDTQIRRVLTTPIGDRYVKCYGRLVFIDDKYHYLQNSQLKFLTPQKQQSER